MIKLKKLLKESKYAWDRKFGDPLPTFKDIAEIHQNTSLKNEGSFKRAPLKRGYWVILSGRGGELTRDFTERKSGIKKLIIDLAREGQIDAGDTISIEKV
jgi:hypothetical protein